MAHNLIPGSSLVSTSYWHHYHPHKCIEFGISQQVLYSTEFKKKIDNFCRLVSCEFSQKLILWIENSCYSHPFVATVHKITITTTPYLAGKTLLLLTSTKKYESWIAIIYRWLCNLASYGKLSLGLNIRGFRWICKTPKNFSLGNFYVICRK